MKTLLLVVMSMNSIGTLQDISIDYKSNKPKITLLLDQRESISSLEEIKEDKLSIEIKKYRKQRSKDANAYFHVLVNELARYFNVSDREMKIKMNLQYGTIAKDINGNSIGIKIPVGTDITQFYDYAKWFGECEDNGIKFDKYLFYKQTHTLNTKEMSQLINGVVQECKDVGIETKTPAEIKSLLESWGK